MFWRKQNKEIDAKSIPPEELVRLENEGNLTHVSGDYTAVKNYVKKAVAQDGLLLGGDILETEAFGSDAQHNALQNLLFIQSEKDVNVFVQRIKDGDNLGDRKLNLLMSDADYSISLLQTLKALPFDDAEQWCDNFVISNLFLNINILNIIVDAVWVSSSEYVKKSLLSSVLPRKELVGMLSLESFLRRASLTDTDVYIFDDRDEYILHKKRNNDPSCFNYSFLKGDGFLHQAQTAIAGNKKLYLKKVKEVLIRCASDDLAVFKGKLKYKKAYKATLKRF